MPDPASPASVVVGTAGHIDHGKTTLLRALTGIDADRLPEERRRGMTIDVGYAHLALPDGSVVDFVDVPGHDRLVGNMLVGAGEIDAALLVVAADDGPNAQTLEHLGLLDALWISRGLAVVTKADLVDDGRRAEVAGEVEALLAGTSLAGVPVLVASASTGDGIPAVAEALASLAARVAEGLGGGHVPRLAIDRVFAVKGRGTVVTGSLRDGSVAPGLAMRLVPGNRPARVREVQVRGATVAEARGGRTALLLGGIEAVDLRRGAVLTTDGAVAETSRILVAMRGPAGGRAPADRERLRLHLGTDQAGALVVRGPREAIDLDVGGTLAILRLDAPVAAAAGDRFALRRPSPAAVAGGGVILDPRPPRGISRRRLTPARAAALAGAVDARDRAGADDARLDLHGALPNADGLGWRLAPDAEAAARDRALASVAADRAAHPDAGGLGLPALRQELAIAVRRLVTLGRDAAGAVAGAVLEGLVRDGVLVRDGDRVRDASASATLTPETLAAMVRLEAALAVAAPPALAEAARAAGCPPDGVRALERAGRIVRLEDDLAWASATYRDLVRRAIAMAAQGPLTPAAYRDATGSSRRYVLVILEDLDRRGLLRRTDAGHVLGPMTLARMQERAAATAPAPE